MDHIREAVTYVRSIPDTLRIILEREEVAIRAGAGGENDTGGVFESYFFGKRVYVVYGAEATGAILTHTSLKDESDPANIDPWYEIIRIVFGDGGMFFLRGEEWRAQRGAFNRALDRRHVAEYMQVIQRAIQNHIQFYPDQEHPMQFDEITHTVAFTNSLVAILGLSETDPRLYNLLQTWKAFALGVLDPTGSGLAGYSHRARHKLVAFIREIVEQRKVAPQDDLVSALLDVRMSDGSPLSDHAVIMQTLFSTYASFDTAANTMSWTGLEFLKPQNQIFHDEIIAEVQSFYEEHGDVDMLSVADLKNFPRVAAFIDEVLRLHSQVHLLPRQTGDAELVVNGVTIPPHSYVLVYPVMTQLLPALYPDPYEFNPHKHIGTLTDLPYARVPFGAGPRACPGRNLATLEIAAMLIHLAKTEITLAKQGHRLQIVPGTSFEGKQRPLHVPASGVPIKVVPFTI